MSKSRTMNFFSSGTFWGVVIVLFGLSILLREIFHINIPFVKILIGIFFIYLGIRFITGSSFGGFRSKDSNSTVFGESSMHYDARHDDYDVVFGNSTIDLFKMEAPAQSKKMEISVVFGNGNVIINDSIPIKIEMNTVFGATVLDGKHMSAFGKTHFTTSAYAEGKPHVFIETNAVFGKVAIQSKKW